VRLHFFFVAPALTPARTPALNVFPSTWQPPAALLVFGIIDKERIGNSPLMKKPGLRTRCWNWELIDCKQTKRAL